MCCGFGRKKRKIGSDVDFPPDNSRRVTSFYKSASVNEVKKTGLFWAAAGVSLAVAAAVAWPTHHLTKVASTPRINTDLFAEFKDPLTAASLKIVTFDEEQGKLATFEVRKDRETGNWTIPSRDGYPADAVEQMKDAANALVGLKILDVQTENVQKTMTISAWPNRSWKIWKSAIPVSVAW